MKTVADLKDSVSGILTGTNLNNVTNLNGALERAARIFAQKADIPEATIKQQLTLYSNVFDYSPDSRIFGGSIVDLRPQGVSRTIMDYVKKQPIQDFDRNKQYQFGESKVTFEWKNGTPIMRVSSPRPFPKAILDPLNATTGWTAAGSASGLTQDETVYYESPASLRMLLTGASTGTLTKSITAVDLSTYEDVGVAFLAIRTPSASDLTSISLRIGSSATNYDEVSATTGFLGAFEENDWLLVAFDFSTATSTGTPDWSEIDYVQIRVTHAATLTNFRVGGLWISLPSPHELIFQTAAIFIPTGTTTMTAIITEDTDSIVLNDAAYTIFEYECAREVAFQMGGKASAGALQVIQEKLDGQQGLYSMYRGDNPSNNLRTVGNYYDD